MPDKKTLKDIFTIIFRLTVTCIVAGLIMGGAFVLTHDAKERNEIERDQKVMYSLLGYDKQNPPPKTMNLSPVHRFILDENGSLSMGYVIPATDEKSSILVRLDLEGNFIGQNPVEHAFGMQNNSDNERAVQQVLGDKIQSRYADTFLIATDNHKRVAYILDGKYPGFKTFIHVKMALNDKYDMLGFEVLEHEEDPGLGAEITQPYFKNQFNGRSAEQLRNLDVSKEYPEDYDDYLNALTGKLKDEKKKNEILTKYSGDKHIYALTGATISSRSVLNGNQSMVKKFVYRVELLDKAIQSQNIQTMIRLDR